MKQIFIISIILLSAFISVAQSKITPKPLTELERIFILEEGSKGHTVRWEKQKDITFAVHSLVK